MHIFYYYYLQCPKEYTGNGTHCRDVDECQLARPCDARTQCTNTIPGYHCSRCPAGLQGDEVDGVDLDDAQRNPQRCRDVDECLRDNGGCVPNSKCVNSEVLYKILLTSRTNSISWMCDGTFRFRVPSHAVRAHLVTLVINPEVVASWMDFVQMA